MTKITFLDKLHITIRLVIIILMHVVGIIGLFILPITASGILLCLAMYYIRGFGIAAGYHRYFSHPSFKTSRIFQFILALLGTIGSHQGLFKWAEHHRYHHQHADTEDDIHSPKKGFWWSHVGWLISFNAFQNRKQKEMRKLITDITKYPELRWLDRYNMLIIGLYVGILWYFGGWVAVYWGYLISTIMLLQHSFAVNSVTHIWGTRRFDTPDDSKNNFWLSLVGSGEGWHNNHHYFQNSARHGFKWWEIDLTFYAITILSWFGVVWDVIIPSQKILDTP